MASCHRARMPSHPPRRVPTCRRGELGTRGSGRSGWVECLRRRRRPRRGWRAGRRRGSTRRRRGGRRRRARSSGRRRWRGPAAVPRRDRRRCRWSCGGPRRTSGVPSVVSCAWRRLTPGSDDRSISGWVFLLVETRPSRTLRWRRGMIVGSPGDGQGSSASWVWYQSGSTQTSASHSKDVGSRPVSPADPPVTGRPQHRRRVRLQREPRRGSTASPSGSVSSRAPGPAAGSRGMAPVVKS